jgi:copper chaperone CopZ
MIANYPVTGMTCGHCVAAVKAEVGAIPGVSEVELEQAGAMRVRSDAPISFDAITAAVAEAGDDYRVVAA